MTRETKIGLLVGLAFVIVIGILISDHLSNTNEPAGAPLRAAADNVRSSLGQQGDSDVAPPLRVPAAIIPDQTAPTAEETARRNTQPPIHFVTTPMKPIPALPPAISNGNTNDRLREIARQNGEEMVDPNATDLTPTHPIQPIPPSPPIAPRTVARSYVAQPGDSLGAIAMKTLGSSCKANRDAIVAANPSLAENRDLIVAGRSYVIPGATSGSAPIASATHTDDPVKPTEATVSYTVKAHDTLWSIATTEVGSSAAVATIKELNKDILNGSDRVRPNMKLRLPARQLAVSN